MKAKNKHIYSEDLEYLKMLQEEYRNYGGWDTELKGNTLTIFALHRKYQNRGNRKAREKEARNKRQEKFQRREK